MSVIEHTHFKPVDKKQIRQLLASMMLARQEDNIDYDEPQEVSDESLLAVVDWANETLGNMALLSAVFDGDLLVDKMDGEITFQVPENPDAVSNVLNLAANQIGDN